jgi:hypothetical protein
MLKATSSVVNRSPFDHPVAEREIPGLQILRRRPAFRQIGVRDIVVIDIGQIFQRVPIDVGGLGPVGQRRIG